MQVRFSIWRRTVTLALLGALCLTVLAAANPYDKFRNRSYSNRGYLSEEDELKLGAEVHEQLRKQHRFVNDSALNSYIDRLGQRLASRSARSNIPYRFFVIEDKSINAFATLGGYVYIHTGLIAATQNEAQLASVLGHEIGHIAARHGLENVKRAQKYSLIAGLIGAAAGAAGRTAGNIGELAGSLIAGGALMKHSRDAEREADYLGLYDLQRAGYNTNGMVEMFEILNRIGGSSPDLLGPILRSHPPASERSANTRTEIVQYLQGSDRRGSADSPEFQRVKARVGEVTPGSRPRRRPLD
jgi:predicted Zn-dependent protease